MSNIKWELTGEILDRVSVYDWEEVVEGVDEEGNEYVATATVSIGIIVDLTSTELLKPIQDDACRTQGSTL